MADIAGVFYEVVRSSPGSALAPNAVDLVQGFYQVGTGSTGADVALAAMGALYLVAMSAAAFLIKKPPPHYASAAILKATALPSNSTAAKPLSSAPADVSGVADIRAVMRCRQFYLLWVTFAALATVGMSIAGTAKDLIREVFGGLLPSLVTPSFAVGYVAAFSLFNLGGRLGWSSLSDRFGKKNTFRVFGFAGLPLALILPLSIAAAVYFARDEDAAEGEELINVSSADKNSKAPVMVVVALGAFLSSSLLVASIFGGTYATVPAFATELFGRAAIDRVHGRLLTASAFAGLCGPVLVSQLRARAERQAIEALVATVDERRFAERFGVPRDQAASLAKARTLTIAKLLEIAPEGTEDPTPWLYTSTLYALSSLFVVAAVTNQMIVKVPGSVFKSGK